MWLGPLSIAVVWSIYALVFYKSDKDGHTTLSSVAASTTRNYWFFCFGLITSGILIFIFFSDWLIPKLLLPTISLYFIGLAALFFQPIVAIVPIGNKLQSAVHNVAAYA